MTRSAHDWIFYRPKFEYQTDLEKVMNTFAWIGHVNFGYDLVANIKPKVIVELGTHWGVSFFSFCQAAKDHSPSSQIYAVDTWKGEAHAGTYGENVIKTVRKIKEKYFDAQPIKLVRKTFDEALADFEDESIDLIHIDGLHTYEAVKHDFEAWLPKLKRDGMVLFHDTAEKAKYFGVYRLWDELGRKYGRVIELPHCHGLGVLSLGRPLWQVIKPLEHSWQAYYGLVYEKYLADERSRNERTKLSAELRVLNQLLEEAKEAIAENITVNQELNQTKEHLAQLEHALNSISNSKFYKLWSIYSRVSKPARESKNA